MICIRIVHEGIVIIITYVISMDNCGSIFSRDEESCPAEALMYKDTPVKYLQDNLDSNQILHNNFCPHVQCKVKNRE
jgi:hypothetical protein